jgi:hypothetical protein
LLDKNKNKALDSVGTHQMMTVAQQSRNTSLRLKMAELENGMLLLMFLQRPIKN